jgi:hypothetical protein
MTRSVGIISTANCKSTGQANIARLRNWPASVLGHFTHVSNLLMLGFQGPVDSADLLVKGMRVQFRLGRQPFGHGAMTPFLLLAVPTSPAVHCKGTIWSSDEDRRPPHGVGGLKQTRAAVSGGHRDSVTPAAKPAATSSGVSPTRKHRPAWAGRRSSRALSSAFPPTPTRQELEKKRVEEAAQFCADPVSITWQDAVADRISDYAETTWERLKRSKGRRNCKALARLAAAVLKGKQKIHQFVGRSSGWIAGLWRADDFTRAFACDYLLARSDGQANS